MAHDRVPSIPEQIAALMPGIDEKAMWRNYLASALEQVAATDDITLLRAAKGADEFEAGFMEFASNFPGVDIAPAPAGGFYGVAVKLAKFDRDLRSKVLRGYASVLRAGQ